MGRDSQPPCCDQGFGAGAFCTGAGFCTSGAAAPAPAVQVYCTSGAGAGCTDDRAPTPAVQLSCTDYSSVNTITKS